MTRFTITRTKIAGVQVIERRMIGDRRGSLTRLFCAEELVDVGWEKPIAQINYTKTTTAGTLRGLHFQYPPSAETKLVICLNGSIFDVAVDLRRGSPSFLSHHHVLLSADNNQSLLIPAGCAHGFQTLTDDVVLVYLHDVAYAPQAEGGLYGLDDRLAIDWPRPVTEMSERDRNHPALSSDFRGLDL